MLEDVFHVDTASSLWSSEAPIKHPNSVIEAHLMFLRAGARLIQTASWVISMWFGPGSLIPTCNTVVIKAHSVPMQERAIPKTMPYA